MQSSVLAHLTSGNPVVQAEFRHQRFVINNSRSGGIWILLALLMVVPALLASLFFIGAAFAALYVPGLLDLLMVGEGVLYVIVMITMVSLQVVVTMITLALAANSIGRERRGLTWDNLRLTSLTPRQIVLGKWWASLRALWGDHLMAGILRAGFLCGVVASIAAYLLDPGLSSVVLIPPEMVENTAAYLLLHLPLLLAFTALYGLLDAGLTAAMGMISALAERLGVVATTVVFGLRAALLLLAFGWMLLTLLAFFNGPDYLLLAVGGALVYALLTATALYVAERLVG